MWYQISTSILVDISMGLNMYIVMEMDLRIQPKACFESIHLRNQTTDVNDHTTRYASHF
jgi:hypothetical protein